MDLDYGDIFKGTAQYYARYRRPYPEQIFSDIVEYYHLNSKGKLLDLGCGTGEISIPLASYFAEVIGVDPCPDMIEEAEKRAEREGILNIHWLEKKAEDLESSIAPIRLAVAGVSFHWMKQPVVFKKVYDLLEDGGGMSIVGDSGMVILDEKSPVMSRARTEDWQLKRKEIIEKYLGPERRAGKSLYKNFMVDKRPYEELIAESPFRTFDYKEYDYTTERSIDEIIGFLYSTSYAAKHLFGGKVNDFEQELRRELSKIVPSGKFVEGGKTGVFFLIKRELP